MRVQVLPSTSRGPVPWLARSQPRWIFVYCAGTDKADLKECSDGTAQWCQQLLCWSAPELRQQVCGTMPQAVTARAAGGVTEHRVMGP